MANDTVPTALERLVEVYGLERCQEAYATLRTFVRSPGFDEQLQAATWLFDQGVRDGAKVEIGPDGLWRGSGEVTG